MKAKFLIKLAIPRQFQEIKKKENMDAVKQGMQVRLNGLMKQKSSIGSARRASLISTPRNLGIDRTSSLMQESAVASEMTLMKSNTLNRRKTILVRTSTLNEAEKEFDWRDRLKQWKQVSQAAGAVTDFTDLKLEQVRSSAFSVLGILQNEITAEKLQDRVETALVGGLRRAAGLTLINFAMNLSFSTDRFFDMVQWMQGTLRANQMQVPHYLHGVEGSGNFAESVIKDQFSRILERVIDVLKSQQLKENSQYVHLINTLCWDYSAEDHKLLERLDVFGTLCRGNNELNHPLRVAWGLQSSFYAIELEKKSNFNLPARLKQVYSYLAKNVLDQVFVMRDQEKLTVDGNQSNSSSASLTALKVIQDKETSMRILGTLSQTLFDNIERYIETSKLEGENQASEGLVMQPDCSGESECNDVYPQDIANEINKSGGAIKFMIHQRIRQSLEVEKVALLIKKLDAEGLPQEDSPLADLLRSVSRTTLQKTPTVKEAAQVIRSRAYKAVALIKNLTWEELGSTEPELSREDMTSVAEVTVEQLDKAIPPPPKVEEEEERKDAKEQSAFETQPEENKIQPEENKEEPEEEENGTKDTLVEQFPHVDQQTLNDIWVGSQQNFKQAKQQLLAIFGPKLDEDVTQTADAGKINNSMTTPQLSPAEQELKAAQDRQQELEQKLNQTENAQENTQIVFELAEIKAVMSANQARDTKNYGEDDVRGEPYSEYALTEIVNSMEQLISISAAQTDSFEIIKCFSNPKNLQLLIQLSVTGPIRTRLMVWKILQQLMALDLPQQTFDEAVTKSAAQERQGQKNRVADTLAIQSTLDLKKSPFLQFIFNRQQLARENLYNIQRLSQEEINELQEQLKTVRQLFVDTTKNSGMRKLANEQTRDAFMMLSMEDLSIAQIDSLLNFVSETALQSIQIGSSCVGKEGKQYRVLGLTNDQIKRELKSENIYVSYARRRESMLVQSYDSQNLERQDIIKVPLYEPTMTLDINEEETEAAAQESIFMDPQFIEIVIDILKMKLSDCIDEDSKLRVQTMKTFFARGLHRILDTITEEFLEQVQQFDIFEELMKYLMQENEDIIVKDEKSDKEWITKLSSSLLETSLSVLRNHITGNQIGFQHLPKERKVNFSKKKDSQEIIMHIEDEIEGEESKSREMQYLKLATQLFSFKIVRQHGELAQQEIEYAICNRLSEVQDQQVFILSALQLTEMSITTMHKLNQANIVITEDTVDFKVILQVLSERVRQNADFEQLEMRCMKETGFITVLEADFATICDILDLGKEKPNSGKLQNPAYSSTRFDLLLYDGEIGQKLKCLVAQQDPKTLEFDGDTWEAQIEQRQQKLFEISDKIQDQSNRMDMISFIDGMFAQIGITSYEEDLIQAEAAEKAEVEKALAQEEEAKAKAEQERLEAEQAKINAEEEAKALAEQSKEKDQAEDTRIEEEQKSLSGANPEPSQLNLVVESDSSAATSVRIDESKEDNDSNLHRQASIQAATQNEGDPDDVGLITESNELPEAQDSAAVVKEESKEEDSKQEELKAIEKPDEDQPEDTTADFSLLITSHTDLHSHVESDFWLDDSYDRQDKENEQSKAICIFKEALDSPEANYASEITPFYSSRLQALERSTIREMLLIILSQSKDVFHDFDASNSLIEQTQSQQGYQRICDLIHRQFETAMVESRFMNRDYMLEKSQRQILALLDNMHQQDSFCSFFIDDLMKRARNLIDQKLQRGDERMTKHQYWEFQKNTQAKEKLLDPASLIFFGQVIFEKNYAGEQENQLLISKQLFDLSISYAIIFSHSDDYKLTHELLNEAMTHLSRLSQDMTCLSKQTRLLKELFSSKLLETIGVGMDVSGSLSKRRKLVLELITRIAKMHERLVREFQQDIPMSFELHPSLRKCLKLFRVVEDGQNFSSFIGKIKLKAMLASEIDSQKVSHISKQYSTEVQKFKTGYVREIEATDESIVIRIDKNNSEELLKVTHQDGKMLFVDSGAVKSGKNLKMVLEKGQKATLEYPAYPQILQYSGHVRTRHDSIARVNEWTKLEKSTQCAPVEVHAMHQYFTLVGGDGSIWGCGLRTNGYEREREEFQQIPVPSECQNYKKVVQGKFLRVILTEDNKLFFSGQPRKYMFSSGIGNAYNEHRQVRENFYRLEDGDKMIDVACGKHYTTVATQNGKVYASGYIFYRHFYDSRRNPENNEDYPFELRLPDGWKALQVYGCEKYSNMWVTCKNDEGAYKSFGGGQEAELIGHNEGGNRSSFVPISVPDGTHFTHIINQRYVVFAIDQDQNLWQWGRHYGDGQADYQAIYDTDEIERRSKPYQVKWFNKQELKCLDVKCGTTYAVIRTADKDGKQEFYILSENLDGSENAVGGSSSITRLYERYIARIEVNAKQVTSYACTFQATMFLFAKKEETVSMDPENPQAKGLLHFYQEEHPQREIDGKKAKVWKFLTQEQYQDRKDSLPNVCFATRHYIKGLAEKVKKMHEDSKEDEDWKYDSLPELSAIPVQPDAEAVEHSNKTTKSGSAIQASQPLYYAFNQIGGVEKKVYATEGESMTGGQDWDLNPVIYYRINKPAQDLNALPVLDIDQLFERYEEQDSQLTFTIANANINIAEVERLELTDEKTILRLEQLKNFKPDQDEQILKEIDKQLLNALNNAAVDSLSHRKINIEKEMFSQGSSLQEIDLDLIRSRKELLFKFNKSYSQMIDYINVSQRNVVGTLSNIHFEKRSLALSSVINKMIDHQLSKINEGDRPEINVNRRRAMVFADEGYVDHEGRHSIYGQVIQQLKEKGPSNLSNFRKKNVDGRIYRINFKGEGSIDAGGPFRDSLVNIVQEMENGVVPLLIKSPNNRNDSGSDRECFILNPSSKSPAHLEMYKYLGAFIAFGILSKSPIPLNLAPTVWKQILSQPLNLNDLMTIDSFSAQVLMDLREYSSSLSDEEFEATIDLTFTTILSNGDEIELCTGGAEKQVLKSNVEEFISLVIKARSVEAFEQNRALQEGINTVFEGNLDVLCYLTPAAVEVRACGEKTIDVERLRRHTTYPNCAESHEIVERFWRVFTEFTPEERASYLKFVWGRNRLPLDLSTERKHELRLYDGWNDQSFPQAHTCFFQLDIPFYKTDEMCRKRLIQASELCGGIDTDNNNFAED